MSIPRVILSHSNNNVAFKVSKPGRSIYSGNPSDFLLNEGMPQAVMIAEYNVTYGSSNFYTPVSTDGFAPIATGFAYYRWSTPHGLPFTPAIAAFSYGSAEHAYDFALNNYAGGYINRSLSAGFGIWVDATTLYLQIGVSNGWSLVSTSFTIGILSVALP